MLFLIIGLGNPGETYRGSRHNAGFAVLDRLAEQAGLRFGPNRFEAEESEGVIGGIPVCLLKPQTYMNLSGQAVRPVAEARGVLPERIAVVHDDLDLALGRIQVRKGGGDGGHRGVRSIALALGTDAFVRLRLGIGRPASDGAREFVLSGFAPDELARAEALFDRGAEAVRVFLEAGLQAAMNRINPWRPNESEGEKPV